MKGAEHYSICSYKRQQRDRHHHSDPTVAAVKRLICRLDGTGRADTPGQRATLQNTRLYVVYELCQGDCRKESLVITTVLSGSGGIWMCMTENDKEKMKGRGEYLNVKSKNNNDHSLRWHAV